MHQYVEGRKAYQETNMQIMAGLSGLNEPKKEVNFNWFHSTGLSAAYGLTLD